MKILPKTRSNDILEYAAGYELMVYDLRIDKAYNLNETSKIIYNACGQRMSFDELERASGFSGDLIYLALGELQKNDLLETGYVSPFVGMNRREVIRRVGLATMVALPVITGLIAPFAARAASTRSLAACSSVVQTGYTRLFITQLQSAESCRIFCESYSFFDSCTYSTPQSPTACFCYDFN